MTDVPEEFTRDRQKREIPFDPGYKPIWEVDTQDEQERPSPRRRPPAETELQALMEAAPGDEPRASKEGSLGMMEALHDAIDDLPPKQKWVVEAHQWRGLTFSEIGEVLSVSRQQAHRIYEQALVRLEASMTPQ